MEKEDICNHTFKLGFFFESYTCDVTRYRVIGTIEIVALVFQ